MKNVCMIQVIFILICVLCFSVANGQRDYMVLTKGDTLYGKVKHLSYGAEQSVQIEVEGQKKKAVYPMLQVRAFKISDDHYHLIRTSTKYIYMKLLSSGYLSLYAFQFDGQNIWNGRYLYKTDGNGMEVPTIGFKKKMTEFLSECPVLVADIESGSLNRNDLDSILTKFNACILRNSNYSNKEAPTVTKNTTSVSVWEELESAIKNANVEDKESVLEMVTEAKSKSVNGEKIPNFLKDALQKAVKNNPTLEELLNKALAQGNQ